MDGRTDGRMDGWIKVTQEEPQKDSFDSKRKVRITNTLWTFGAPHFQGLHLAMPILPWPRSPWLLRPAELANEP